MAEYVKLRLTAAKVGVTMALLGLIGGIAEKARAAAPTGHAAATLPGGTLGNVYLKIDSAITALDHKITSALKIDQSFLKIDRANSTFLKIDKANTTFLKIDDAATEFLKIDAANTDFLKIDAANTTFMKIVDANNTFLKIDDAANEFLKITDAATEFLKVGGTAANSQELGGLPAVQFVQGRGGTAATSMSINGNLTPAPVLQTPDKMITVSVAANADEVVVHVNNNTGALLPAVMTADGSVRPAFDGATTSNLQPGDNTLTLRPGNTPHQFELQTFGDGSSQSAVTTTLSTEASPATTGSIIVVCQMLIGLL